MKAWEVYNNLDWCKYVKYKGKNDYMSLEFDENIVSCCLWGAICIAYSNSEERGYHLRKITKKTGKRVAEYNDENLKSKDEAQKFLKELDI